MDKQTDGTQNKSRGAWRDKDIDNSFTDPDQHSGGEEGGERGKNKSVGSCGETHTRESSIESIKQTFLCFTGKILGGLLAKSRNDKRVWTDRLQEARDCLVWYQNLLEKCENEISIADAQIAEVEEMLLRLEQE